MRLLALIAILFTMSSCESSSDAKLLAPLVDYVSDTMYARRKPLIRAEVDSLCLELSDGYRQAAIDSLIQIERRRIKELSL